MRLTSARELDLYIYATDLADLVDTFALADVSSGDANVSLRALPDVPWPFIDGVAPLAAVAADLAEDTDARSQRIGRQVLSDLDAARLW